MDIGHLGAFLVLAGGLEGIFLALADQLGLVVFLFMRAAAEHAGLHRAEHAAAAHATRPTPIISLRSRPLPFFGLASASDLSLLMSYPSFQAKMPRWPARRELVVAPSGMPPSRTALRACAVRPSTAPWPCARDCAAA